MSQVVRPPAPRESAAPPGHRVDYDRLANRLTISVRGFWALEDVPRLAAAVGGKAQEARAFRSDFDVLVESFDFPVQANHVADLLTNIMHGGMMLTSGRVAVVVGSQLNKLQAGRTLVHPRLHVCMTMAEAEAWLAGED